MDPDRYQKIMTLFESLCDLPAADRAAQLDEVRVDDPELAAAIEEMLAADDEVEDLAFMATPDLRCPVCQETFPAGAEFCPTHGSRLRAALVEADPMLGMVLDGRYRIDTLLARGGMGVVYRGRQINVERDVAIKVLRHDRQHHPDISRRFAREARIIAGLRHPNTLKLIDFGYTPFGTLYIVNPLLSGRALDRVITEDGPLDVTRTLNLVKQVTSALVEAHERGIVHRDLKPANIFVEQVGGQEVFKVLDFGVAKLSIDSTENTATGAVVGTPAYMSPEQIEAAQTIDGRSDLYSLGVVAYVCLTGELPWDNVTPANMALKHLHEPPIALNAALPDAPVPPAVERLVMGLLAKLPSERPADARALRAAVEAIERVPTGEQAALELPAHDAVDPLLIVSDPRARTRALAWGGVALIAAGLIGWFALRDGPVEPTPAAVVPTAAPTSAPPPIDAAPPSDSPIDMALVDAGQRVVDAAPRPVLDAAIASRAPKPRRTRPRSRRPKVRATPSAAPPTYKPAPGLF